MDGDIKIGAAAFVDAAVTTPLRGKEKPALAPLHTITAAELLAAELPARDLILSPWLACKGTAMIFGTRGIGKTWLTMGIAYAIASGGCFLGWRAGVPRKVLIIDGEMPAVVLQERLAETVRLFPTEPPAPDYLRFLALDMNETGLDVSDIDHQERLEPLIGGAEVLILDNISTLSRGGKENESESWLPVQEWALVQRRAGRSVIFIHHAGKGGQQRGTSRREDILDTVISLRRPQDHEPDQGARFEVHFEKNRGFYGDEAKPFEAALGAGGWTTRDLADADMAKVVKLTEEGLTVRDIAEEIGMTKSRVARIQKKARDGGAVLPEPIKPGRKPSLRLVKDQDDE